MEFAQGILNAIKRALGIESPSKLFRDEVGKNIALGVGVGFQNSMASVANDMSKTIENLSGTISSEVLIGDIPKNSRKISQENNYITKNYSSSTEVIRQPSTVILEVDKKELGRVLVPAYDKEKLRLGVSLA